MKRKVMSISVGGRCYECIRDDEAAVNPFRVYQYTYTIENNGLQRTKRHGIQVAKYGNFESVILYFAGMVERGEVPSWM